MYSSIFVSGLYIQVYVTTIARNNFAEFEELGSPSQLMSSLLWLLYVQDKSGYPFFV